MGKHERKDSMLGLSAHIPTPITLGLLFEPTRPCQAFAEDGFYIPLIFQCGIAKYQRKKT